MDLKLVLLADYANVTKEGKLNVMGIFTYIYAKEFPARHPEMWLITKVSAGSAELDTPRTLTVRLLSGDATVQIMNWSKEFTIPRGAPGRRQERNHLLQLRDLVFPTPGTYQFSILVDNDEKGTLALDLIQAEVGD